MVKGALGDLIRKLHISSIPLSDAIVTEQIEGLECQVAPYCYISNSDDFIVASNNYRSQGPRYDWVEVKQELNDTRWFAQAQFIVYTLNRVAIFVKTCEFKKTRKETIGYDLDGIPIIRTTGLNHEILTDSPHITWQKDSRTRRTLWNALFENEIIGKWHVIELPGGRGEFLVNDKLIL